MSTDVVIHEAHSPALIEEPALVAARAPDPKAAIGFASECAALLKDVLQRQKLITRISGNDHVQAEGWTLLAAMTGYSPRVAWSRKVDPEVGDGWEARVELLDGFGRVVSAAEAMALRSEPAKWTSQEYSVRSMAMTRATSRAIRLKLGYIVTMAGYSATAAEEMPPEARGGNPTVGGASDGPRPPAPASSGNARPAPPAAGTDWQADLIAAAGLPDNDLTRKATRRVMEGRRPSELLKPGHMQQAVDRLREKLPTPESARYAAVTVPIPSASRKDLTHLVMLRRMGDKAVAQCTCEAFRFGGACRHVPLAWGSLALSWLTAEPISAEALWEGIDVEALVAAAHAEDKALEPKTSAHDEAVADRAFGDEPAPGAAA